MKDTAAQAVAEFIRSPDLFQFDLFESPAIKQLKGDSKYGHLYELLEIVLNGDLQVSVFDSSLVHFMACIITHAVSPFQVLDVDSKYGHLYELL